MTIQITADGINITKQIRHSLRIEQNINDKVDICDFIYRKFGDRTYVPETGHEIIVTDNGVPIFAGLLIEYSDNLEKEDITAYKIKAKDYTHYLDRRLVAETYKNKTPAEIVREVVATYAPDITVNNVDDAGTAIPVAVFNYQRTTDVISDLASFAGCDWFVDYNKDLHFKKRGKNLAPFNLKEEYGGANKTHIKGSLTLKKSDKQIKNVIFVVGDDAESPEVDEQIAKGDANQKVFDTIYKFSEKPEIKVDGVVQSVGVAYLDDPLLYDCVWSYNEKNIVFNTAPSDGLSITARGNPLTPLFVRLGQPDAERGTYEYKITDDSLKTYDAVRDRAKAELDAYANSIANASFDTYRSGLQSGQKIFATSEIRGVDAEEYIIQTIVTTMHDHSRFIHAVSLANVASYDIVSFMRDLLRKNERALDFSLTDTLDLKINFEPILVWGNYEMTNIDDPKRVPIFDGGLKWPA